MILARIPGRRPRTESSSAGSSSTAPARAVSRLSAPDDGRVRPVSPLGPAMVLALGGVMFSGVRRMRARSRRRAEAAARRAAAQA